MQYRKNTIRSTCFLLIAFTAGAADAGDFTAAAGARSLGTGGVYSPSSESALDAMALNPAGLSLIGSPVIDLSAAALFARGSFSNSANSGAPLSASGLMPYGAFATPLGKSRFTLGVAVLPELTSAAKWKYTDAPGGVGGVSYGSLNSESQIIATRGVAGLGISVTRRLDVGLTVGAVYNSNILRTAYVFQDNPQLAGLKTLLDLKTSGVGVQGSAGMLFHASRRVMVGAAWQSAANIESHGDATGNIGIQLAAIGLGAARPDFRYDAQVNNRLPQSVTANVIVAASRRTRLLGQADWIDWSRAFANLPVILTNGNNADINGVLGSTGIKDAIPLRWHDQVVTRFGVEREWLESAVLRAGFAHSNMIVPSDTLSPLTAALTMNTFSAGFGYRWAKYRVDLAYTVDPTVGRHVGDSILKSGEYSNSNVRVGTQGLVISTSFRL